MTTTKSIVTATQSAESPEVCHLRHIKHYHSDKKDYRKDVVQIFWN